MPNIDLDAARAARAEVEREPITFTLEGQTFTLPREYPMKVAVRSDAGDVSGAMRLLLSPEDYERFDAIESITADDTRELLTSIANQYALQLGESSASAPSSPNGSRRSRPTSRASTA